MKRAYPIFLFLAVLLFCLGLFQQWVLPRAHAGEHSPPSSALVPAGKAAEKPVEGAVEADLPAVDKSAWELVLVNAQHVLDGEYPVDLEAVDGYQFDRRAAGALRGMIEAAHEDEVDLVLISTYRSFEKSEWNFNEKVKALLADGLTQAQAETEAQRWVARPGMSEHNTGLALDVVSSDYFDVYGRALETAFEGYRGFQWLYENCANHGFILRYPAGKEQITGIHYEPWHYRYVGPKHAKVIMEQGITLEEYLSEG